jgi:hypothetical protein
VNRPQTVALGVLFAVLAGGILFMLRDAPDTLAAACLGLLACGVGVGYCLKV